MLAKESGGRVHAVSRAGASGPLQFMYQTGLGYGLGRVDGFDTRFDPQLAARASVAYLNDRFAELNHNLELVAGGLQRRRRAYSPVVRR
jgi:membrane-bound lytic murein transglycosylase D